MHLHINILQVINIKYIPKCTIFKIKFSEELSLLYYKYSFQNSGTKSELTMTSQSNTLLRNASERLHLIHMHRENIHENLKETSANNQLEYHAKLIVSFGD